MSKLMTMVVAAMAIAAMAQETAKPEEPKAEKPSMHEMRPPRMPGDMGADLVTRAVMNPRVAEKLNLTDEQKAKLKELRGNRSAQRAAQEKVRAAMKRQRELLQAEKLDEAAVMQAVDEVFEARKAAAKDQMKQTLAVRSLLTPEQVAQAVAAMKELRGSHRGMKAPAREPKERPAK